MLRVLPMLLMVAADQADLLRYRRLRLLSELLVGVDDPALLEPYLLSGEVLPGQVFFWEPDLPHAREVCVVTRILAPHAREVCVAIRPIDGDAEVWNDMSRFRQSAVRTTFKDHPPRRAFAPSCGVPFPVKVD